MSTRWECMICGFIYRGPSPPQNCPNCGAPFTAFQRRLKSARARLRRIEIVEERPPGFRYVIVGNSAAGRSAARAIRALDPDGQITVVSEEETPVYARPLLPDFIGGMDADEFFQSGEGFATEGLELILGNRAERIDLDAKQVICASGPAIPFDAVLLATGSSPRQVPWPGSEADGIAYFRTFADAERIAGLARNARHAVVVGGGLLGLEFVRAFHAAGLEITHLVRESYAGAPALDERGGTIIAKALADIGVQVALEEEVEAFESRDGRVSGVRTNNGRTIECDLVGIAVGAMPRLDLARDLGVEIDRGVVVNRRFQTTRPEVYAAGDVAQAFDRVWGEPRINASWRNAQEQGEAAGIAMAGGAVEYPGAVAANYQLAAGLPFCSLGIANPPDPTEYEITVDVDVDSRTYRKIVKRDGKVVGACLIGNLSEAAGVEEVLRGDEAATPAASAQSRPAAAAAPSVQPQPGGVEPPSERKSAMHEMTKSNLQDAFAGESQAHLKYLNFAEKAAQDGKENVARLFRAASFAEQVHATRHLEALGGISDTGENLATAIAGETFEIEEMYPAYIAVAEEQEEDEAIECCNFAYQAEKQHQALYQRAKKAVDAGGDVAIEAIWVCSYCGHTVEGEPPDKCPVCGSPKNDFVKF